MFGESLKQAIEEATKNSKKRPDAERKAMNVLNKWLRSDGDDRGRFRQPMPTKINTN